MSCVIQDAHLAAAGVGGVPSSRRDRIVLPIMVRAGALAAFGRDIPPVAFARRDVVVLSHRPALRL
jgi:hypothetical protein